MTHDPHARKARPAANWAGEQAYNISERFGANLYASFCIAFYDKSPVLTNFGLWIFPGNRKLSR